MMSTILLIIFTGLQLVDAYTTRTGLKRGGAREGNPLLLRMMNRLGVVPAIVVSKVAMIGLAAAAVAYAPGAVTTVSLALACAFYAWIAFNNLRVIKGRGRS